MNGIIITVITLIIILSALIISLFLIKKNKKSGKKEQKSNKNSLIANILYDTHEFNSDKIYNINKNLIISINKRNTRIAIIKNFNPKNPTGYSYKEIPILCISKIKQSKTYLTLSFIDNGIEENITIRPAKKEYKKLLYELYKKSLTITLETKYKDTSFDITATSDWDCSYLWAYSKRKATFVYYDREKHFISNETNLLKTNLILDTRYSYLEMPIYNINQQLLCYESEFYDNLFNSLLDNIKARFACVLENAIYYDNNGNVIYLTNNAGSLQIINLSTIEEVYYYDNKLTFKLEDSEKLINFWTNHKTIKNFENFVINLNLRKIAQVFNYSSDKLINTSDNTKLIIDFTRSRLVYCANLNSFARFSYYTISFNTIKDATYIKNGQNKFVRLTINKKDKIDITCKKAEVAQYILAQIQIILRNLSELL